jgi:hypothetical protein
MAFVLMTITDAPLREHGPPLSPAVRHRRRLWTRLAVAGALLALAAVFLWRRDAGGATASRNRPAARPVPVVTAVAQSGDMPVYALPTPRDVRSRSAAGETKPDPGVRPRR